MPSYVVVYMVGRKVTRDWVIASSPLRAVEMTIGSDDVDRVYVRHDNAPDAQSVEPEEK